MIGNLGSYKDRPWAVSEFFFRLFIAVFFIIAGVMKVPDAAKFQQDILNYHLVPHLVAGILAIFLPWFEIVCSAALIFRKFYFGALAAVSFMMTVFTVVFLQAQARGIDINCGCFGKLSEGYPAWVIILRDFILLASLAFLWWLGLRKLPQELAAITRAEQQR